MTLSQPATALLALCSAAVVYERWKQHTGNKQLPPGPKPLPLIGNALDMPRDPAIWETFLQWSREYDSDIIYVNALGQSILVLNSLKAAEELLDQRSGIYSGRPHMVMFHELSGLGGGFSMLPYGDLWRANRRIFTKHLSPTRPEINQPREVQYVGQFLLNLLDNPEDFKKHIRYVVGANALSSIYGFDIQPVNDPYLGGAETVVKAGSALTVAGAFLVDTFPFLKHIPPWFPGAKFHQVAADIRAKVPLILDIPFAASVELKKSGSYHPSLATNGLEEIESLGASFESSEKDVEMLKEVCSQAFLGAADSTVAALGTFFLAMVLYPEVQKRAQHELDEVLQGRLPEHDDLKDLPYLNVLVMEVLRWHPVLPIAVPHVLTGDDIYRDYHIPADTIVIPNIWAILQDEEVYPDPTVFRPERFLNPYNGKIDTFIQNPLDIAFGFGRRICPGRHLALSLLTYAVASVLSSFDLMKQLDKDGNEIEVKGDYELGVICQPANFPCRIKPRSREANALVERLRSSHT